MKSINKTFAIAAISLSATMIVLTGSVIAEDIVKTRKAAMEMLKDNMKVINGIVEAGSAPDGASAAAAAIHDIATKIPSFFPEGSGTGDTTAKPEIWQDWNKFTAAANETAKAAEAVAAAAKAKDAAALKTAFNALGGTCGSCHQDFKAKK